MKFFKNKSKKQVTAPAPRELKEIQAEYGALCAKAGELQYVIKANSDELERLNTQLLQVNQEGAARKKLDAEAQAKVSAQDAVKEA